MTGTLLASLLICDAFGQTEKSLKPQLYIQQTKMRRSSCQKDTLAVGRGGKMCADSAGEKVATLAALGRHDAKCQTRGKEIV